MERLKGKVAVVTGGWRGNGRGIAEGLAAEGAAIVIADVNEEGARQTAREIADRFGVRTLAVHTDVADVDSAATMVDAAVTGLGGLDCLVNNAGIMPQAPFLEMTPDFWRKVLAVNLDGPFYCSQAAAKHMKEHGGGSIINIASMTATNAVPNTAAYCVSKGGLMMLTKSMAVDLAPYGIRVNAITPAIILTDINRDLYAREPERLQRNLARVPMGRIGLPEDLAGPAVFLASDDSAYVTGVSLPVDGGYLAR